VGGGGRRVEASGSLAGRGCGHWAWAVAGGSGRGKWAGAVGAVRGAVGGGGG
jgi:hypothetical protein